MAERVKLIKKIFGVGTSFFKIERAAQGLALLSIFILVNALKVALFNFLLITHQTVLNFVYKFSVTLIITFMIYSVLFLLKRPAAFIIFYLMQVIYIFANLAYFFYFHNYLHLLQSIGLIGEGVKAARALSVPADPRLLLVLLDLPFFIGVLTVYRRAYVVNKALHLQRKLLAAAGFSILVVIEAISYTYDYSLVHFLKSHAAGETIIVQRYGTLANNLSDYLKSREQQDLIARLRYGKTIKSKGKAGKHPNIFIIQLESMDSSVVSRMHNGQYIAPFLKSLSEKSVYYPYVLSYHMGGGTSDSEFSIINSVHPLDNYPAIKLSAYDYYNSILFRLSRSNYAIKAFHGNEASYFNRNIAFPRMGFDKYYGMKEMGLKHVGWGAPDHEVISFVKDSLTKERTPFFYYLITMTTHAPFTNARHYYINRAFDDIASTQASNYFNSVAYADENLKGLVDYIQKNFANTYILIWGDHTPAVNNKWYKQASLNVKNRYMEFVPLFILTPDKQVYVEEKKAVSFLDIAPTILEASGVPYIYRSDGINLLNPDAGDGKIPLKGTMYDRQELYRLIDNILKK